MNEFDRRWQEIVARARQVPERPAAAPFGFATRVLASAPRLRTELARVRLWERLGLRALAAVTAVLVVVGALEYRDARAPGLGLPRIEHCVTATFWML